ncbi:MAG: hypothetical protein E4G98_03845 [Promethearchaeota archaeon]|nr:MAG: hypothetical protein E4G98_03845 [Candidatus Lokiarchaeota archaeon]
MLKLENIHANMLDVLFHSLVPGKVRLTELDNADGEIGLSLGNSFFGVINIGDTTSFLNLVQTYLNSEFEISPKYHFEESLFFDLDNPHSHVNFLIGSKKFIEGWNSYRVSTMVLLNIGKREGPQIIQLFGRGVRLYGYDNSLLRSTALKESTHSNLLGELPPIPKYMSLVETLNIFGLNADYMATFQSVLNKEFEYSLPSRDSIPSIDGDTPPPSKLRKKVPKIPINAAFPPKAPKLFQKFQGHDLKQILDIQDEIRITSSTLIHTSSVNIQESSPISAPIFKNGNIIDFNAVSVDYQEIYLILVNFCVRRHYTQFYFTPRGLEKWLSIVKYSIMGNTKTKGSSSEEMVQYIISITRYAVLIYQNLFIRLHHSYPNSFFLFVP